MQIIQICKCLDRGCAVLVIMYHEVKELPKWHQNKRLSVLLIKCKTIRFSWQAMIKNSNYDIMLPK